MAAVSRSLAAMDRRHRDARHDRIADYFLSSCAGMVRIQSGRSGIKIVRFNAFERFMHWMTATCFILMALTGLNITFGKVALLPLIGPRAFSTWSLAAKYAHNFLSFPFTLGVILIFLMWLMGNIPNRVDVEWFKRGGGIVGHDHPPAYRFNAGQKAIYWIVVFGGAAVAVTGYLLMFPFYGTTIAGMQLAQMVHGTVAVLFVAVMIAHALYRYDRHGRCVRSHGRGHRRPQLGRESTTACGSRRNGRVPAPAKSDVSCLQRRLSECHDADGIKL